MSTTTTKTTHLDGGLKRTPSPALEGLLMKKQAEEATRREEAREAIIGVHRLLWWFAHRWKRRFFEFSTSYDAEDLVSEFAAALMKKFPKYKPELCSFATFASFTCRSVIAAIIKADRAGKRSFRQDRGFDVSTFGDRSFDPAVRAEDRDVDNVRRQRFAMIFAKLPERQRVAFGHRFGIVDNHARNITEIADLMGCGCSNVSTLQLKAMAALGLGKGVGALGDVAGEDYCVSSWGYLG